MKLEPSRFITYCKEQLDLSENSLRAYQQDLATFQKFLSSQQNREIVDTDLLIAYHQYLRENVEASPATIRRRFITLRSYFEWLTSDRENLPSPFQGLRLDLKVPQRLPRPVDRPTLQSLFNKTKHLLQVDADESKDASYFSSKQVTGLVTRLLVVTGMRIGEITKLRIADISGACTRIRVHGKGNRERTVYVANERLLLDFRTYIQKRATTDSTLAYLFLNSRGDRLTEAAFRKRLRTVSSSLLISPYLTPHRFRHSAATMLIEEGVDIRIVQRLLGHTSISTTEIYTKVSDNSLVAAIEKADTLALVDT